MPDGSIVCAAKGLHDAVIHYRLPFTRAFCKIGISEKSLETYNGTAAYEKRCEDCQLAIPTFH